MVKLIRCVLTLFFALCLLASRAQNAAIDSISRLIPKATSDTERINLAIKKIGLLTETNIDSSMALGKKTIEEARRLNYSRGEAGVLLNMSSNYSIKGDYVAAEQSLKKTEAISSTLDDSSLFARAYSGYGMMYGMQAKYDTSIMYYTRAIAIDEKLGNLKKLSAGYGNLAIGYQMQSNFPQALLYQQKSLSIAEKQNDLSAQAYTMMNMGNTYQNIGDTLRSEKAILKGIELAKKVGIRNVELYGYSNLATLYNIQNKWDACYDYAMKASNLAKTMGDAGIEAASLSKAALALAMKKKYGEAESLGHTAMAVADSSGQPFNIFQVYSTMGTILKTEGKYREAIPFLEKSFMQLKGPERFDASTSGAYADLSACYENTGDFNKALAAYKSSAEILDSVRSKENIRKATELSMNYEFEKKQTLSDAIQGKKNAEARLRQLLLLVGLGLALLLAGGGWIAFRNKQKATALLEEQKTELQSTLSQLKLTQSQLVQSEKMASLGELTAGIAHEIQNPLNFVNNFSEVNTELFDEMEEELERGDMREVKTIAANIKKNLEKISHHGKRADGIVKGMLQHSRTTAIEKEFIDINALADEYLRLAYHGLRARDKSFNAVMKTDFDVNIGKIKIIPQDIGRVILNLITNAFYAVSAKKKALLTVSASVNTYEPTVSVSTRKINGNVEVQVSDNGNGIPKKVLDKIYQPFFTTKPTGEGTGLGLSLSYDIVKAHGGEIKVETNEGEGTVFSVHLPA
jgi:two-component system, NtrC family, sensor kinase